MFHYFQKNNILKTTVTDTGLFEITFKDHSRYLGQMNDDLIQGQGTFYIQDIAKFEGKYFNNKIFEGTFFFDSSFIFEGKFDENEQFSKGVIELIQTREKISISCLNSKIMAISVEDQKVHHDLDIMDNQIFETSLNCGINIFINADKSEMVFRKTYSENLTHGDYLSINLTNSSFFHYNYENDHQSKLQKELYFKPLPYVKTYNLNETNLSEQKFTMKSSNGYSFESKTGYEKGVLKEIGKEYSILGGIKECYKNGDISILFSKDNCEMHLQCIEDKICFDNIEKVFDFVRNFDCSRHPDLRFSENIAMMRFMENISYFEGSIREGNSTQPVFLQFRNGLTFSGKLNGFKMNGKGTIKSEKWECKGEFVQNELKYGSITYQTGARYDGQILDYNRNDFGKMKFVNEYIFAGKFVNDRISQKVPGQLFLPNGHNSLYTAVDMPEFDLCIFVSKNENEGWFVWNYTNDRVYDAGFIDQLESSGIRIRDSLRNIEA